MDDELTVYIGLVRFLLF